MTIAQQLTDVNTAKQNIKTAIEGKGVSTTGVPFTDYHTKIGEISGGGGPVSSTVGGVEPYETVYIRNPEYLPASQLQPLAGEARMLATIADSEYQTVVFKVFTQSTTGTVQIEWGDGNISYHAPGNTSVEHTYNFADLPGASETSEGYRQAIITVKPWAGALPITVINFEEGYPSWATTLGQNSQPIAEFYANISTLTRVAFGSGHNGLKDIEYVQLDDHDPDYRMYTGFTTLKSLRKVKFPNIPPQTNGQIQQMGGTFRDCYSLEEVEGLNTTGRGSFTDAFHGCGSLKKFTNCTIDYSSSVSLTNTFYNCRSLRSMPVPAGETTLDLTNCRFTTNTFYGCFALQEVPDMQMSSLNTSLRQMFYQTKSLSVAPTITFPNGCVVNDMHQTFHTSGITEFNIDPTFTFDLVTTVDSLFRSCEQLVSVNGTMNLTNCTVFQYMFRESRALQDLPILTGGGKCSIFQYMFYGCWSLIEIAPHFQLDMSQSGKTPANLNQYRMFTTCYNLRHAPQFLENMVRGYRFDYMFQNCPQLLTVPSMDMTATTTTLYCRFMLQYCRQLQTVGTLDMTGASPSNASSIFNSNYNLKKMDVSLGPSNQTISYASLSATELNKLYTNLPTTSTTYTLTVSTNPGYAASDTSIATAKGWVVN